jgi:hypothetical protein
MKTLKRVGFFYEQSVADQQRVLGGRKWDRSICLT